MSRDDVEEMLERAYALDDSPAKVAILEEAVREIDALGDEQEGFDVRLDLVTAATFCGLYEKALVAFTWCLAAYDRDADICDVHDLLWRYKWIAGHLPSFVQVSRDQIINTQNDMQRRYAELGYSLRPVEMQRAENAMAMGDLAEAERAHAAWRSLRRDELADCAACEADQHMDFLIHVRRDEEAVAAFEKLIAANLRCSSVPQRSHGKIIRSFTRLGREDDAQRICQTGYRMARSNQMFLSQICEYLLFHVRHREIAAGVRVLENHLPWAIATTDSEVRVRFFTAAGFLCELLARENETGKLRLPRAFPLFNDDGVYETAKLHDWFAQQAENLTARFNERNGNDYYTKLMQESRELAKL